MKIESANGPEINGWQAWKPVSTIMRKDVPTVSADCSGAALTAIFAGVSPAIALVVDAGGEPIGIVLGKSLDVNAATAAATMEPVAFTLSEWVPISLAAALMASAGVNEIPIVAAARDAVGVLTARDILAWVARQAGHRIIDSGTRTETTQPRNR